MKTWIDTTFTTITQDGEEIRVPDLGGAETNNDVQYSVMDRDDGTCLTRVTATEAVMPDITGATATTEWTDADAEADLADNRPQATLENLDQPDIEVENELAAFTVDDLLDQEEQDTVAITLEARREVSRRDLQAEFDKHEVSSVPELVTSMSAAQLREFASDHNLSIPNHIGPEVAARAAVQAQTVGGQVLQDQELTAMNKIARAKGLTDSGQLSKNTRADMDGDLGQTTVNILEGTNADHADMLDYIKGNAAPPWTGDTNPPAKGSK